MHASNGLEPELPSTHTFEAKAREERVSVACTGDGARLAIISALALPPNESCSSIVSLEFLHNLMLPISDTQCVCVYRLH